MEMRRRTGKRGKRPLDDF